MHIDSWRDRLVKPGSKASNCIIVSYLLIVSIRSTTKKHTCNNLIILVVVLVRLVNAVRVGLPIVTDEVDRLRFP